MPRGKKKTARKKTARGNDRTKNVQVSALQLDGRLDSLLAAVRSSPDDIEPRLELGEYYLRHDQEDKILDAVADLDQRYPFTDSRLRGWYNVLSAFGHVHRKDFVQAEKAARRGLEENPDSLDFFFVLIYLHLSLREYNTVVELAQQFISIRERIEKGELERPGFCSTYDDMSQLYNFLGSAYFETDNQSEGQVYFEKSIAADPGNHLPYLNLARLLQKGGKDEQARQVVKDGLARCRQVHELRMLSKSGGKRATVSACMMVKNEEELLPGCLDSIRDWVDEIIVVDTGSTDRTVEIARSYGAEVFFQEWEGDFSKHRNYSVQQATCDWVFIIDADERLYREDIPLARNVVNKGKSRIYSISVYNVIGENEETVTFLPSARLFRRELNLHYESIVHNQLIIPPEEPVMRVGIRLKHLGYGLSSDKMEAKTKRSMALLEKQIIEQPEYFQGYFNYAQLLRGNVANGHPEYIPKILDAAGRVLELTDPTDSRMRHYHLMALHQVAWAHFASGRYDLAADFCLKALEHKPYYLDPLLFLGQTYFAMGEYRLSEEYYHKYLDAQRRFDDNRETDAIILLHGQSVETAQYGLGCIAEREQNREKARIHFEKALEAAPGLMLANNRLAKIYLQENNLERAEECFGRQLEADDKSVEAALGLAEIYYRRRDFAQTDSYFQVALEISPHDGKLMMRYGQFCLEAGNRGRAAELFKRALETVDPPPEAGNHLAETYFQLGRYQEAADTYTLALEQQGPDAKLYNDLGNCYYKIADYDKAENWYQEALEIAGAPSVVYRNMGLARVKLNKIKEAIAALERFLELMPDQYEMYQLVGDLYSRLADYNSAILYYERFLQVSPGDAAVLYSLSECYLLMGHRDSAILGYRRVLEADPGFSQARERLSELAHPAGKI